MTARAPDQGISFRERLGRIWRWPLYSRARFGGTLIAVVVVALALPSPGTGADTSASPDALTVTPAVTWYTTPSTTTTDDSPAGPATTTTGNPAAAGSSSTTPVDTTGTTTPTTATTAAGVASLEEFSTPNTGDTGAGVTATGTGPAAPDLLPTVADYASPASVATRYLQAWCYAPAFTAANTNIAVAASWMTAAGWDDDKSRAVTDESWAATRNAGITTMCGPVTVEEIPAAPHTDTVHWVAISADRTYYDAAGLAMSTETVNQTRQVVLGSDGRWLVDVQAAAS